MANPEIQPMLDAIGFVNDYTAITELKDWPVTIRPNPCISTLNIFSSKELGRIKLINSVGQEVMRIDHKTAGIIQLDVSGFKSGVYILSLYDINGNILNQRVVKR